MGVYVAEINGRPIAAVNAHTEDDAKDFLQSVAFREELLLLDDENGNPLWDGIEEVFVRSALADEETKWRVSASKAAEAPLDEDDQQHLAFLLAVTES